MQSIVSIRLAAVASFAFSAVLYAQVRPTTQTKPSAAQPSTSLLPATAPTPPPPPTPAQLPPQHAQVTYAAGALSVSANNSSLNQILRTISQETGIKITGGVVDERVFGQYGPGTPSQILSNLLDGTGSNMLLVQADGTAPAELILTSRHGGPSPPSPSAHAFDDVSEPSNPPVQAPETPPAAPAPEANHAPATPATGASPADSGDPQSPNGVKTPQQIYDQLQRLRQQQQTTTPQ
jgi:hypothetical protein